MTEEMREIQLKIMDNFDCIQDWWADPDLGFKVLPISGQFVRTVNFDTFISRIKALLPRDAKLMLYNGAPLNMGFLSDLYSMVFGSKTWPLVPEGQLIPQLQPLFLAPPVADPVFNMRAMDVPEGIELRLVVDKRTHSLLIPKEEETDEQCVVIVRPK